MVECSVMCELSYMNNVRSKASLFVFTHRIFHEDSSSLLRTNTNSSHKNIQQSTSFIHVYALDIR